MINNIEKDFANNNGVLSPKNGFCSNYGFKREGNKIVSLDSKYMLSWITTGLPDRYDLKPIIRDDVTYNEIEEKIKSASDWRTSAEVFELLDGVKYVFDFKDGTKTRYGFPRTNLIGLIPVDSKVEVAVFGHWDDYLGEYVNEYKLAAIPA